MLHMCFCIFVYRFFCHGICLFTQVFVDFQNWLYIFYYEESIVKTINHRKLLTLSSRMGMITLYIFTCKSRKNEFFMNFIVRVWFDLQFLSNFEIHWRPQECRYRILEIMGGRVLSLQVQVQDFIHFLYKLRES